MTRCKKILYLGIILAALVLAAVPSFAEDTSQTYSFNMTANNKVELTASPGDEFEIAVDLKREDAAEMTMYAASYVLMFDTSFFEFDKTQIDFEKENSEGITYLYSENTGLEGWASITISIYPGVFEGVAWDNDTEILKFNLKSRKAGASTILCRNAAMSNAAGQSYTCNKNNVVITVIENDDQPGGESNSGGSGNTGGTVNGNESGGNGNGGANGTGNDNGTGSAENPSGGDGSSVDTNGGNGAVSFSDVLTGAYYYDAVKWAVSKSITKGTDSLHFSPDAEVSRAQVVTFLYRAAGEPAVSSENPFKDVSPDAYYYKAVLWAAENNITTGTDSSHFSPEDTCTRAQIVTFLARANKVTASAKDSSFTDVASGAYYSYAVSWAVDNKITNGISADKFGPDEKCTRAQIVTFLYRCWNR